jgi:hypothetical protein
MRGKKHPRLAGATECALLTTNTAATNSSYMRSAGAFLGPLLLVVQFIRILVSRIRAPETRMFQMKA